MFALFFILIVGPVIVNKVGVFDTLYDGLSNDKIMYLIQPTGLDNNDTSGKTTGSGLPGGAKGGAGASSSAGGGGGGGSSNPFGGYKRAAATAAFVYNV